MIILRVLLYSVCLISLGWSVIVFGGPLILQSLLSSYSDNQLIAKNIQITPRLDVKVGKLEFVPTISEKDSLSDGYARSIEVKWSLFSKKPFIKVLSGPTFLDNSIIANRLEIFTPSFSEINFDKILLGADIKGIRIGSHGQIDDLIFEGVYERNLHGLVDILLSMPTVNLSTHLPWRANNVLVQLNQLNFRTLFDEQPLKIDFTVSELGDVYSNLNFFDLDGVINLDDTSIAFTLNSNEFKPSQPRDMAGKLSAEGLFLREGSLDNLVIHFSNSSNIDGKSSLKIIDIELSNLGYGEYTALIKGVSEGFNLQVSDSFIGRVPVADFEIEIDFDVSNLELTGIGQIKLTPPTSEEIHVKGEFNGNMDSTINLYNCRSIDCILASFTFNYVIDFDEQWISGTSSCFESPCGLSAISHTLKTSNTVKVFEKINDSHLLNPLFAFYLYGAVTSGQNLNGGHTVSIN